MTCASCSQVIEDSARILQGLDSIQVNFATETAELKINENFNEETFYSLMKKLGYRATDPHAKNSLQHETIFDLNFYKMLFAIILSVLTMSFAMGPATHFFSHSINNWIQAIFTSVVVFSFGLPYVKAVLVFCRTLKSNMNTLIGLGSLSAYGYSLYLLLFEPHAHSYFEGTSFIIAFALLGHYFDQKAKTKARSTLSSLYKMQIKFASKLVDGQEINTAVIDLKLDDIIRLRPGEKFPLDGEIVSGETHVDESMITGESQAIIKKISDKVFAGSINIEGSVTYKVKTSLHDTFISQIVSFVEKAQMKKAPIQQYADKIVRYFVPVILFLAAVTFFTWFFITGNMFMSLTHMIGVLVIACPCALGLAVPMVIMLATAKAAQNGLLVSGGDVLEKGAHIQAVVFDKTGTLTSGQPELTAIVLFDSHLNHEENYFLQIAASCAQYSSHPLSQCLFNSAVKKNLVLLDPDKFQSETGLGVIAEYQGKQVLLGNSNLLSKYNCQNSMSEKFYQDNIGSYVFLSIDQVLVAAFVITDPVKPEAITLIKKLHSLNLDVWMLTGDHSLIAQKIGQQLGITPDFIRAQLSPSDKAKFIEELQDKNLKVAMVGDGINDAPALSKADLSIAMGNGTDVAIEASEVSVLEGKILLVADFFHLSNKAMRIIKENLILSSLYNLLCIPLAAGVFYPWYKISLTPMWASLAMGLSSFSVIVNSFRVRR
jgi:Cu+-exporting ATPase